MNRSPFHRTIDAAPLTRREFLWRSGGGLGGIALASMLDESARAGGGMLSGMLHHPAKAKRVVQFFMAGAASASRPLLNLNEFTFVD